MRPEAAAPNASAFAWRGWPHPPSPPPPGPRHRRAATSPAKHAGPGARCHSAGAGPPVATPPVVTPSAVAPPVVTPPAVVPAAVTPPAVAALPNATVRVGAAPKRESSPNPVAGWLVCLEGPDRGRDYRLHMEKNFIGRAQNMDVVLDGDSTVSREKHAIVIFDPRKKVFWALPGEASGPGVFERRHRELTGADEGPRRSGSRTD